MTNQITLEQIEEERRLGWVNFHPEDYCHRCGRANLSSWYVDGVEWTLAVGVDTHLILCPQCFVAAWNLATRSSGTWELRLDPFTDKRIDSQDRTNEEPVFGDFSKYWRDEEVKTRHFTPYDPSAL